MSSFIVFSCEKDHLLFSHQKVITYLQEKENLAIIQKILYFNILIWEYHFSSPFKKKNLIFGKK